MSRSPRVFLRAVVAATLLALAGASPSIAQGTTSIVKGRVVDTDGGGIPSVVLVIRSKSQPSGNKQVVTDIEGNYRIPLLPPANDYMIKVDYPGFAPMELGPLDLDPGKTTVADVTLRTSAEMTDVVHVEARGNQVDTEKASTGTSYNAEFIEGLPIIGHNFQDVLKLAPGVTDTDGDGNANVHGARDTGLQIRLDGANITDPVSGTFGQNLNQDIIEELEVITAGAAAEFSRADGGFANIITKSGGNDFEGKFSVFWQGKFLNGDGANNNDTNSFDNEFPQYNDLRPTLTLGGAVVKDKVWYFGSVEVLDTERPVNQIGSNVLVTSRGNTSFGKVTWQVNTLNKLALQVSTDPRTFRGLGLALGVSPDSDFEFKQGGITPQLKWTSTISPQLLLEAAVSAFDSGIGVSSVSRYYEPTEVTTQVTGKTIQALYPCDVINCDPRLGERKTFQTDLITGRVTGPFNVQTDDSRSRNAIKTDLSFNVDDALGQHNIKSGIEFADEGFQDTAVTNPLLIDVTQPFQERPGSTGGGAMNPNAITGVQVLQTFNPLSTPQRATSFNSGFYLQNAWKPRPNLTVNVGLRYDREDVDSSGFGDFDPRVERKKAVGRWSAFCDEARTQGFADGRSNCLNSTGFDGTPPTFIPDNTILSFRDGNGDGANDVDPRVAMLDIDGDGFISTSGNSPGSEGFGFFRDFTRFLDRETENFQLVNNNLAPRFSISWDPFSDGKTKVFGNWSRFYDRLFLATVTGEIGPDNVNYSFFPNFNHILVPGDISRAASTVSVAQIDRNLKTPYTDEVSIGFERELAPEWSFGFTYIRRKGNDLLQDTDVNHLTCDQHGEVLGISPQLICGDNGQLETDRFGGVGFDPAAGNIVGGSFAFNRGFSISNGAPDLYTVNNGFNQILRISNVNSSKFESYELKILKRLHRNWQMQASYAWSKAFGQSEAFAAAQGNDPQTTDDEEGFLNFDQRHILKFQAVTRLPHEISLGTVVQWASGTPFSVTQTVVDQDSTGNVIFRTFFPTEQRNDQRNDGQWEIDARIEKSFTIGSHVQASGFLNVQNLLNADWLTINNYDLTPLDGVGLNGQRNFGRRFELGAVFNF